MVHSPVELRNRTLSSLQFPASAGVEFVDCTVREGEALYVPSFFWHEVASTPSEPRSSYRRSSGGDVDVDGDGSIGDGWDGLRLNVAINYWFAPLFTKDFPCAECRKKFNHELYREVLEALN